MADAADLKSELACLQPSAIVHFRYKISPLCPVASAVFRLNPSAWLSNWLSKREGEDMVVKVDHVEVVRVRHGKTLIDERVERCNLCRRIGERGEVVRDDYPDGGPFLVRFADGEEIAFRGEEIRLLPEPEGES